LYIPEAVKFIKLTKDQYALVDEADFDWLNQWKWMCTTTGYAYRWGPRNFYKRKHILMHRLISGDPQGMEIDHIDGDKLNNRRSNLRPCSRIENARNQRRTHLNKSGYKGVFWHSKAKKWCVQISMKNKGKHVGLCINQLLMQHWLTIALLKNILANSRDLIFLEGGYG
jgi:hypothetical protein